MFDRARIRRTNQEPSMSLDNMPDEFPSTESHGELVPPPRKPPTALTAPASGPDPRRQLPARRWQSPTGHSDISEAMLRAVDAALDTLDAVGDAVRETALRLAR
jgi:hypothetical protein